MSLCRTYVFLCVDVTTYTLIQGNACGYINIILELQEQFYTKDQRPEVSRFLHYHFVAQWKSGAAPLQLGVEDRLHPFATEWTFPLSNFEWSKVYKFDQLLWEAKSWMNGINGRICGREFLTIIVFSLYISKSRLQQTETLGNFPHVPK